MSNRPSSSSSSCDSPPLFPFDPGGSLCDSVARSMFPFDPGGTFAAPPSGIVNAISHSPVVDSPSLVHPSTSSSRSPADRSPSASISFHPDAPSSASRLVPLLFYSRLRLSSSPTDLRPPAQFIEDPFWTKSRLRLRCGAPMPPFMWWECLEHFGWSILLIASFSRI